MLEKVKKKLEDLEKKVEKVTTHDDEIEKKLNELEKKATDDRESEHYVGGKIVVKRPPFAGRYYIYGGKKYLFTHRHPYEQWYWSDDTGWIPTDKLKEA